MESRFSKRLAITNVERKQHTIRSSFTNTTHSLSRCRSRELVAHSSLARRAVCLKSFSVCRFFNLKCFKINMFRSFPLGAVVIVCSFVWRSESILLYPNNTLFQVTFPPDFNSLSRFLHAFIFSTFNRIFAFSRLKSFRTRRSVFSSIIEIRFRNLISEWNQPNSSRISVEQFFPNQNCNRIESNFNTLFFGFQWCTVEKFTKGGNIIYIYIRFLKSFAPQRSCRDPLRYFLGFRCPFMRFLRLFPSFAVFRGKETRTVYYITRLAEIRRKM